MFVVTMYFQMMLSDVCLVRGPGGAGNGQLGKARQGKAEGEAWGPRGRRRAGPSSLAYKVGVLNATSVVVC